MRTVEWSPEGVRLIDQRQLPRQVVVATCRTVDEVAAAIRTMQVRGAPAIGACAGFGIALGAQRSRAASPSALLAELQGHAEQLAETRPTAVNLEWALARVMSAVEAAIAQGTAAMQRAALAEAESIADSDVIVNKRIGAHGATLLANGDTVLTHCNAGGLACVDYGTALGVIRSAHDEGIPLHVLVDETRPFLQGARLTAWELSQLGIPHTLITDNMAGHFMQSGKVQKVIVGADRIAANGDVANKIGTYSLAVLARHHGIPFFVAAPTATVDLSIATGTDIPIEERSPEEVRTFAGTRVAPADTPAAHPAFDVTPHRFVTAIITETGILKPSFGPALSQSVTAAQQEHLLPHNGSPRVVQASREGAQV
jgi:methylthioribose-1-phosphate isomerase